MKRLILALLAATFSLSVMADKPSPMETLSADGDQCVKKKPALRICFINALLKAKADIRERYLPDGYVTPNNLVGLMLLTGQATLPQVIEILGQPIGINTTLTQNGMRTQLVYPNGAYVYLTNGHVTATQN